MKDEIPAWVCQQWGEAYFEERKVDAMPVLIKTLERQSHHFAETVFSRKIQQSIE
jgi:hypothetical protein